MRAAGHALPSWVLGAHAPQAGQLRGETHLSSTTHLPEGQTVRRSASVGASGSKQRKQLNKKIVVRKQVRARGRVPRANGLA